MQLKLASFSLFSFALLARASSPHDENSIYSREWEGGITARDPQQGWYPVYDNSAEPAAYPDSFLEALWDRLHGKRRAKARADAGNLTTRELLDELTDRLWEARGLTSSKASMSVGSRKRKGSLKVKKGSSKRPIDKLEPATFTPAQNAECRKGRGYDCNQRGARIVGPKHAAKPDSDTPGNEEA